MAYIGNIPAEAYTSFDKQTITGDGGASYTLDHAVANEQEIEVFVNNVRQEPSVAYTVSGTALTMTGNVESSDDFYVVFQGKAIQTTSHPGGQDLKARDGTFTGDVTAVEGTFSGNISVTNKVTSGDTTTGTSPAFVAQAQYGSAGFGTYTSYPAILNSSNSPMVYFDTNNSNRGVFAGGVTFNGDTAAANVLDDYEEGTWTPTVTTATSVDSTSSGHGAHYTKVGNLVTFQVYMIWTNSTNNNSSLFEIGGLPFTSISDYGSFNIGYVGSANMNDAVGVVSINTNKLYFHQNDGTASSITNANIHTRGLTTIILTGSYFAT